MGSFCPRLCVLPYSSTCLWYSCGDMGEPLGNLFLVLVDCVFRWNLCCICTAFTL